MRFLVGLFVLALSVFRLTTIYHEYLAQIEHGVLIETTTYAFLILLTLWFIGRGGLSHKKTNSLVPRRDSLMAEFADGFLSSLF